MVFFLCHGSSRLNNLFAVDNQTILLSSSACGDLCFCGSCQVSSSVCNGIANNISFIGYLNPIVEGLTKTIDNLN